MYFAGHWTPHIWLMILKYVKTKRDFKNLLLAFPELGQLIQTRPGWIQDADTRFLIRDWIWSNPYVKVSFKVPKSISKSEWKGESKE